MGRLATPSRRGCRRNGGRGLPAPLRAAGPLRRGLPEARVSGGRGDLADKLDTLAGFLAHREKPRVGRSPRAAAGGRWEIIRNIPGEGPLSFSSLVLSY